MATTVYSTVTITLQDGTEVLLRPLAIKQLRKFMTLLGTMSEVKTEEEGVDVLLELAALCIATQHAELVADQDKLEEALDMPTVYKIIEVCGGVKLNDPKLLEAAMESLQAKEDGTN